jgi:F-type H+-transporting ATPase subunit b
MRVPVRHNRTIASVFAAFLFALAGAAGAEAQSAPATQVAQPAEHATQPPAQATQTPAPAEGAHQAAALGEHQPAAPAGGAEPEEAAAEHSNPLVGMIARLFNFALLAGTLFYLLRSPLAVYLTNRSTEIRKRLVKASDLRAGAAAEQAAIAQKMQSLPAELEALRKAGAEEVAAEEARIRQAAESERERLLDVTRRDIGVQLKLAERALMRRAADLAVEVASERVKSTITEVDQLRLVDRYLVQVGK